MSLSDQDEYLVLLSRGASPSLACQQLGFSLITVARTLETDADFQALHQRVKALLSQNVAAALYRAAIEGKVTAQTFFLKNCPPPEWPRPPDHDASPDETELPSDDLIQQAQQLLAVIAADAPRAEGGHQPG